MSEQSPLLRSDRSWSVDSDTGLNCSSETEPVEITQSIHATTAEDDKYVVQPLRAGNRDREGLPCLPTAGHWQGAPGDGRTGGAIEVKLQRPSRTGASPAHVHGGRAASKVDVVELQPTAVRGVSDVKAAFGVVAGLRLKVHDLCVARSLNLPR